MKRPNFDILDENHDVTAYERHYTSSLLSTRQRRNSSPAISTSWPQPWSRGQASVRHPRMTGGTPAPNCFDFHSQSQGRCWSVRTALETLSTQIGGEWSASRAKENYWTLLESEFDSGSTSHLFDTPVFDSMIATISWRQMHKTINFARQLQTNHEQTCTQNRPKHPRVDSQLARLGLRRRRSVTHAGNRNVSLKLVDCGRKLRSYQWILLETRTHNLTINRHSSF